MHLFQPKNYLNRSFITDKECQIIPMVVEKE